MTADESPNDDGKREKPRRGNQDKFAWFYAMYADTEVSNAAKVVGAGCVMKMAGQKGYFKATRKAIANLCGISQATVRRGLDDLMGKRYLDVQLGEGSGAANTYHLILPAQRYEEWLNAESAHEREIADANRVVESWLFAENKWRNEQIEKQFRVAIYDASIARGADAIRAARIGDWIVTQYREKGIALDIERGLQSVAISKQEIFTPPAPESETPPSVESDADQKRAAPGSPMNHPRLTGVPPPAHR